jgi:hypothetical protein
MAPEQAFLEQLLAVHFAQDAFWHEEEDTDAQDD